MNGFLIINLVCTTIIIINMIKINKIDKVTDKMFDELNEDFYKKIEELQEELDRRLNK